MSQLVDTLLRDGTVPLPGVKAGGGTGISRRIKTRPVAVDPAAKQRAPATVGVVIPCYNYARYLPAAVNSVLSQEGVAVDIVIVDDASTDDSRTVARAFARRDARVRVIEHAENAGPVATFNDGLEAVRGEFLVRLDADDLLTPGSLQRAVAVARRFPSVGLVYGHPLHFTDEILPPPRRQPTRWTVWPGREWLADRCRSGLNVITSPEVLMRSAVVRKVGGQQPLAHTHDMEMWLRLAAFSDVAYIHGADQAWHRDHAESLSARAVDSYRDLVERHQAFDTLFSRVGGEIPESEALRKEAMVAIASSGLSLAARCYEHGAGKVAEAAQFIAFAKALVPDLTAVPGWRGLQRRIAVGPERTPRDPLVVLDRIRRRLASRRSWRRWHRDGVF